MGAGFEKNGAEWGGRGRDAGICRRGEKDSGKWGRETRENLMRPNQQSELEPDTEPAARGGQGREGRMDEWTEGKRRNGGKEGGGEGGRGGRGRGKRRGVWKGGGRVGWGERRGNAARGGEGGQYVQADHRRVVPVHRHPAGVHPPHRPLPPPPRRILLLAALLLVRLGGGGVVEAELVEEALHEGARIRSM